MRAGTGPQVGTSAQLDSRHAAPGQPSADMPQIDPQRVQEMSEVMRKDPNFANSMSSMVAGMSQQQLDEIVSAAARRLAHTLSGDVQGDPIMWA